LIEKIAGIKKQFSVEEIRDRVVAVLNQLLMKWILQCGKDMFHLQADAFDIAKGIREDLDMEICKIGIGITGFTVESFSYPEEIQKMAEKAASQSMVSDMAKYTQFAMADGMSNGNNKGSSVAGDMAGLQMGLMMGKQMMNTMQEQQQGKSQNHQDNQQTQGNNVPNFCPNCGTKTNGTNFCANCGAKLV